MKNLRGSLLFAQSGGPTAVINAGAAGAVSAAMKNTQVTRVLGAIHGIKGVLTEHLFDLSKEDPKEIELLKTTPSAAFGSVRYRLKNWQDDESDYLTIYRIFQKYDVRFFLYSGGNDSMDTCHKVADYLKHKGYDCAVIGVPKTIDNDLTATDHCPGFGSAAKYLVTSVSELILDAKTYDVGSILVMEMMGRNAGWLTAASALARKNGFGPDLIYLPERPFDLEKCKREVLEIYRKRGCCFLAVSEGIRDAEGHLIGSATAQAYANAHTDAFSHVRLGGVSSYLAAILSAETGAKTRAIEFSLLQRCAAHSASLTDVKEAFRAGEKAVLAATKGETDKMVTFTRLPATKTKAYRLRYDLCPLAAVANVEKKVPDEYIAPAGNDVTDAFIAYATPLIAGESLPPYRDGVPVYARLKKIPAEV